MSSTINEVKVSLAEFSDFADLLFDLSLPYQMQLFGKPEYSEFGEDFKLKYNNTIIRLARWDFVHYVFLYLMILKGSHLLCIHCQESNLIQLKFVLTYQRWWACWKHQGFCLMRSPQLHELQKQRSAYCFALGGGGGLPAVSFFFQN